MKPLVRWTVGEVSKEGLDCLGVSIRCWKRLFPQFDTVICYNGIDPDRLTRFGVELLDQSLHVTSHPVSPRGPAWILYPPRLRPDSHEIFIDNDLVVYNSLPQINDFLCGSHRLFTQAYGRNYGVYESEVPQGVYINSGLFGLPPGFVFRGEEKEWETHYCEQGYVASQWQRGDVIIPMKDITVAHWEHRHKYLRGAYGTHFIGLNWGHSKQWLAYRSLL
jgi:hypothetical protein